MDVERSGPSGRWRCRKLIPGLLAAALFVGPAGTTLSQEPEPEEPLRPMDPGLIEGTGVALMLLDVEVTDKRGRPIRDLTKDDFTVQLNGQDYPIYSVDDFCSDGTGGEDSRRAAAAPAETPAPEGDGPQQVSAGEGSPVLDPVLFVLYCLTWICPAKQASSSPRVSRFVAGDGAPVFRFEDADLESAGDCFRITDSITTEDLAAGVYTYHLSWTHDPDSTFTESQVDFRVAPRELPP